MTVRVSGHPARRLRGVVAPDRDAFAQRVSITGPPRPSSSAKGRSR